MEGLEDNPFTALFPSLRQAVEFASEKQHLMKFDIRGVAENVTNENGQQSDLSFACSNPATQSLLKIDEINSIIQDTFLITLNNGRGIDSLWVIPEMSNHFQFVSCVQLFFRSRFV